MVEIKLDTKKLYGAAGSKISYGRNWTAAEKEAHRRRVAAIERESALDKPAGTLSRTSAETRQVYSSVAERKVGAVTPPVVTPQRVTAADMLKGQATGRESFGIVRGKLVYGATYGEGQEGYQSTFIQYDETPTQQIKDRRKRRRSTIAYRSVGIYALSQQAEPEEFKMTSELTAAKQPKNVTERLQKQYSQTAYTSLHDPSQLKRTAAGYTLLGVSAAKTVAWDMPKGIYHTIRHPIQSAKGLWATFKDPQGTIGGQIGQRFKHDPAGATGSLIGFVAAGEVYGGVGKVVKIKPVKFQIPITKGKQTLYRGIAVETGQKAYNIAGIKSTSKLRPSVRTPKFDLGKAELSKGLIMEGAAETKIFRKSLSSVASKKEIAKFDLAHSIMKGTETTPSKFIRDFQPRTKTLSKKGVSTVLEFAKRKKGSLYGSFPAEAQMPKGLLAKGRGAKAGELVIGDIDVSFKGLSAEKTQLYAQELAGQLKKAGEKVQVKKGTSLIEAKGLDKQWHHAVDIHSTMELGKDVLQPSVAQEKIYGLRLGQPDTTIGGVEAMPLSELGLRKGASILTLRSKDGKVVFYPEAHRVQKEFPDFFTHQETLIRSTKNPFLKKRLRAELTEWSELYPDELKSFGKAETVKMELYSPPKTTKGISGFKVPSVVVSKPRSYSVSKGRLPPISPSLSPSKSIPISPSLAKSLSPSVSKSPSPSKSISPYPSPSKSISPSLSPSPSPSPSKSLSPYMTSPSLSPSPTPKTPFPTPKPYPYPLSRKKRFGRTRKTKSFFKTKQPRALTPSGWAAVGSIKGKITKGGIKTGLGARPIKKLKPFLTIK